MTSHVEKRRALEKAWLAEHPGLGRAPAAGTLVVEGCPREKGIHIHRVVRGQGETCWGIPVTGHYKLWEAA